jgi:hypothetical protein
MRITKEALRRIIREAVKRKLEESDINEAMPETAGDSMGGTVDAVAAALVTQLIERVDSTLASNAYEMVMGLGEDESMMRPGRYEDVEHFASQAVDKALSDPELKDALLTTAMEVIKNLMEPG